MTKKEKFRQNIDAENGINFNKNINLNGYCFYKGDSFIAFNFEEISGVTVCKINYVYLVNKNDLIKLLSFCINFWAGNACKFIFFMEHARPANYCEKYLSTLGFTVDKLKKPNAFKHPFKSTNGFAEDEVIEYYL